MINRMKQMTDMFNKLIAYLKSKAAEAFKSFPQFGQVFTRIDPGASKVVRLPNHITVGKPSIITY